MNTRTSNLKSQITAFTLVEMLVVISIIVVLLALLAPAMDRAIYQAELAVCGARLHGVALNLQTYAMASKRYYPPRNLPIKNGSEPNQPGSDLDQAASQSDDRPAIRAALGPLNPALQCPLTGDIDIDKPIQGGIWATTDLWFSWNYRGGSGPSEKGSHRLGEPFTWTEPTTQGDLLHRFDLLASDDDIEWTDTKSQRVSHPDKDGVTAEEVRQENPPIPGLVAGTQTYSWWTSSNTRGPVDLNYAFSDGSVQRFNDLLHNDPRMVQAPAISDITTGGGTATFFRPIPESR